MIPKVVGSTPTGAAKNEGRIKSYPTLIGQVIRECRYTVRAHCKAPAFVHFMEIVLTCLNCSWSGDQDELVSKTNTDDPFICCPSYGKGDFDEEEIDMEDE